MSRPTFAENLQAQMDMHGINQPELARRVRVKTSAVSRWLSGERFPGGLVLLAVCRVLETDPWKLVGSTFQEPLPASPQPKIGRPKVTAADVTAALDRSPADRTTIHMDDELARRSTKPKAS